MVALFFCVLAICNLASDACDDESDERERGGYILG